MASERSFPDRVQKSAELKAAVLLLVPTYAPADSKFAVSALTTAITASTSGNATVESLRIPYQDLVDDREALLKTLGPLVTQALNYVKSNTLWAKRYDAIKRAADKARGVSYKKTKNVDPDPDAKVRQSGERSYVEIANYFKIFVDRLMALGGYLPPDTKITTTALYAQHTLLAGMNTSMPGLEEALADAISDRHETFFNATGLKFVFDGVKAAVKGQYGVSTPQYGMVKGIKW